jgi:uncharacterized membrane protein (DUF2068 family)
MSKANRPASILLLILLELFLAALSILQVTRTETGPIRHVILVILAIAELALAYGFWTRKGWAWLAGITLTILGTGFSIFSLFRRPNIGAIIYLLVDLLVIYYLMQPKVHNYFRHGKVGRE